MTKKNTATKSAPVKSAPVTKARAKALVPTDSKRSEALAAAKEAADKEARALELKEKWRKYYAEKRAEKREEKLRAEAAPKKAKAAPVAAPAPKAAPVAPVVAPAALPAQAAMVLSKADLIGGIKAALTLVTDEQQKLGLQYALQLAQKLAD